MFATEGAVGSTSLVFSHETLCLWTTLSYENAKLVLWTASGTFTRRPATVQLHSNLFIDVWVKAFRQFWELRLDAVRHGLIAYATANATYSPMG